VIIACFNIAQVQGTSSKICSSRLISKTPQIKKKQYTAIIMYPLYVPSPISWLMWRPWYWRQWLKGKLPSVDMPPCRHL